MSDNATQINVFPAIVVITGEIGNLTEGKNMWGDPNPPQPDLYQCYPFNAHHGTRLYKPAPEIGANLLDVIRVSNIVDVGDHFVVNGEKLDHMALLTAESEHNDQRSHSVIWNGKWYGGFDSFRPMPTVPIEMTVSAAQELRYPEPQTAILKIVEVGYEKTILKAIFKQETCSKFHRFLSEDPPYGLGLRNVLNDGKLGVYLNDRYDKLDMHIESYQHAYSAYPLPSFMPELMGRASFAAWHARRQKNLRILWYSVTLETVGPYHMLHALDEAVMKVFDLPEDVTFERVIAFLKKKKNLKKFVFPESWIG